MGSAKRTRRVGSANPAEPPADAPPASDPLATVRGRVLVAGLLALGVAGVAVGAAVGGDRWRPTLAGRWPVLIPLVLLVAAALVAGAVPATAGRVGRLLARVRDPSPDARRRTALALALVTTLYVSASAIAHNRDLKPFIHDENSYALQTTMLARGRLWMLTPPMADFFDTFHVLTRPVYASAYFPGAALLLVPGAWLGLPTWVLPACFAGACVGLSYRVVAEVADGLTGLCVALALPGVFLFNLLALAVMANIPVLMLGLLAAWAYLKWRSAGDAGGPAWPWALLVGFFCGWAAVTRPVDAIALSVPIGLAMAWRIVRGGRAGFIRRGLATLGLLVAGALPFLVLQAVLNVGITGSLTTTPFGLYAEQSQPGVGYSLVDPLPPGEIASPLMQKQEYYHAWMVPLIEEHGRTSLAGELVGRNVPAAVPAAVPVVGFLALLPAGLLMLRTPARWAVVAPLPLLLLCYAPYTFFLPQYVIAAIPATLTACLLGPRAVERAWPAASASIGLGSLAAVAAATAWNLPESQPRWLNYEGPYPASRYVHEVLPYRVEPPAVVLVRYDALRGLYHDEPVYNYGVPTPDDAPVVLAHDLGPRNAELVEHYARTQPERTFYLLDRQSLELTPLGRADRLYAGLRGVGGTTRPAPGGATIEPDPPTP